MRKIILLFVLCSMFTCVHARTVELATSYVGASHFNQAQATFTVAPTLTSLAGMEVKWVKENAFKHPIFSLSTPLSVELETLKFALRPFYYFKNTSENPAFQNATAFGINGQLRVTLKNDEVNEVYTHAFLNAAFARQKGTVFYENDPAENRYYNETAYSLGLSETLYNAFGFDLEGAVFQYPDGVSEVAGLRSIMNQQELAPIQTLDVVHALPKYAIGTRLTRLWSDNGSTLYASYRYGEYHTADSEHSIIVGNSFIVADRVSVDIAYNHVLTVHNQNRRDIGYIRLSTYF